jgi:hypothetical protein
VLDVGARDRHLAAELDQQRLTYYSADVGEGHDYQVDLEQRIDLPDQMFDCVVALDVLEHVEYIHQAFSELARITRHSLIVGLPNMATLSKRWTFLWRGHLGTRKYDLYPEHQGDRHRWLTTYAQNNAFIEVNAFKAGLTLERVLEEVEGGRVAKMVNRLLLLLSGPLLDGSLIDRCIYVLVRE